MPPFLAPIALMWALVRELYDLLKTPHSLTSQGTPHFEWGGEWERAVLAAHFVI